MPVSIIIYFCNILLKITQPVPFSACALNCFY